MQSHSMSRIFLKHAPLSLCVCDGGGGGGGGGLRFHFVLTFLLSFPKTLDKIDLLIRDVCIDHVLLVNNCLNICTFKPNM